MRRAGSLLLATTAAMTLAACGGGFRSSPPSQPDETITSYVALGDDFTAAPDIGKAVGDDDCRRSDKNYPRLLAEKLGIDHVKDVSCAGATTQDLTDDARPAKGRPTVPAQLDAVGKDTDLVTIGISIADRDLLTHAFHVCTALPCPGKVTPQTVLNDVKASADALTSAVRAIQDRAPESYIVLVGYPEILPGTGSCKALPKVDQSALDVANIVLDQINHQVRAIARDTGAAYADIGEISVGHELCSDDPWVKGGPRGNSVNYHPVAAEQRAVADAIADLVKSR